MKTAKYITIIVFIVSALVSQAQYTWEQVTLPDTIGAGDICFFENDIYLATGNGVYHSDDNCENWNYIGLEQYPIWSIHVSSSGNLYAGTSSRIFKYTGNNEWDLLYTTIEDASNILSIYESDSGYIFFGNWGGIYRSTDAGINWTEVLDLNNTEVVHAITENSEGILFSGSTSYSGGSSPGGVYSSEDGGANWQLMGLSYHFVSSIVINSDDEIFVGTNGHWSMGTGRIYKSADNGQNWDMVFNNHYILSLSINEYDEVAAASETGIFCTYDGGVVWEEITPDWTGDYYEEVAFHPSGQLYAISYFAEADLFRTETVVSIPNDPDNNQTEEISVFPNPAKDEIQISLSNASTCKITITDISGIQVLEATTITDDDLIKVNIQKLKPGLYFIYWLSKSQENNVYKFVKY